jgi:hypothetical protein
VDAAPGSVAGMNLTTADDGQATVELVALLPLIGILVLVLWQAALAGEAVWLAGTAARAAARAHAVGADPATAARTVLPGRFERELTVRAAPDGTVAVALAVPALIGGATLTTVSTRARFEAQR